MAPAIVGSYRFYFGNTSRPENMNLNGCPCKIPAAIGLGRKLAADVYRNVNLERLGGGIDGQT